MGKVKKIKAIIDSIIDDMDGYNHLTKFWNGKEWKQHDNYSVVLSVFYTIVDELKLSTNELSALEYIGLSRLVTEEGCVLRRPIAEGGLKEVIQHDDCIALCAREEGLALLVVDYGLKHGWHYDQRTGEYARKGFYEWIRCLRQPMHACMMIMSACGTPFTFYTLLGYVQLLLAIILEPFLSYENRTSQKILFWIWTFNKTKKRGVKFFQYIYNFLMKKRHGKFWKQKLINLYYGKSYPKFAELMSYVP
jgi:hypothetical protein